MSNPHFGQEPPKLKGGDLLVCFYVMFLSHVNLKLDLILVENQHLCFRICCFYSVLNNSVFQRSDATNLLSPLTCFSLRTRTQCFFGYFSKLFVFLHLFSLMREKWCWGAGMKKTNTSSLPAAGSLTIPKRNGTNTLWVSAGRSLLKLPCYMSGLNTSLQSMKEALWIWRAWSWHGLTWF